jgi:serine/threonine-protein kinase
MKAADLAVEDLHFTDGEWTYVASGKQLGHGGMGTAWLVTRWRGDEPGDVVVAKTFREEFLASLSEDDVSRHHFDHFERVLNEIIEVKHENVLPVLKWEAISDNFLMFTPLAGASLLQTVALNKLSPRERAHLLLDALRGLAHLHRRGIVHRDFTLHNVLALGDRAVVFDFDLSIIPSLLADEERSYREFYQGRVLGSPEFSIAPELLDPVLVLEPIGPRVDVYAAGTALHALFSEHSVYGDAPDLASLFQRISDGVVHRGESRLAATEAVPPVLLPVIRRCLEREPSLRYADAGELVAALEGALELLSVEEAKGPKRKTVHDITVVNWSPDELYESRLDPTVTLEQIQAAERTLARYGYLVEQSLGRVKGHPIYLAMPDPELVGAGQFASDNIYRKIVTTIDLSERSDANEYVQRWLTRILPIVKRVRQGYLTALYKVVHDREAQQLLLFTEWIADARFGTDLEAHSLSLEEVFGLGLLGALSIGRLHDQGLAHNNVVPESLVFKGLRESGRVYPLFLGLVEPSFDAEARAADVRNLAAMIERLIRPARIDALKPEVRPMIEREQAQLREIADGALAQAPSIHVLTYLFSRALGEIVPNFELVRAHEGDIESFADLLVRHSLYNKLFQLDIRD